MSRIKKLETHYHKQLTDYKVNDVSKFIQFILDADITKGKYARFLIEAFLNDQFLEEDLVGGLNSSVGQAVSLFDKHKGKLPIEQRSVYALDKETKLPLYQSPGDLWKAVKQFQGELSGKELKKEEQEQIYRETEFIYKNEETGFQIISPLTENSAKWWGKGTRWCTSADNNNMFERYSQKSPLLILLMPNGANIDGNGDKLQLWKNGNNIQFMDELDNTVSLDYMEKHWSILKPLCLWLNDIRFMPEKYITKEMCEIEVQQNGCSLKYVPEYLKTKELCELAIKNNNLALQYIPEKLGKKYFYNIEINKNGSNLRYIPKENITKELCELAFQQNIKFYRYFSEQYKTYQNSLILIQNDGMDLQYVPKELRTRELCELAVKNDGMALQYVPEELKTPELCKLAVNQNGCSLQYIPERLITKELCELAVEKDGIALEYVSNKIKNIPLCRMAIQHNGMALQYVPLPYFPKSNKKTFFKKYFKNNNEKNMLTEQDFYNAVKQNGESLKYIPEYFITKELCELAVKQSRVNILYCTKDYRLKNQDLIRKLLDKNEISISYIYNNILYDKKSHHWNEVLYSFQYTYSDLSDLISEYQKKEEIINKCQQNTIKNNYKHPDVYNEIKKLFKDELIEKKCNNFSSIK